jgi:hypothetical protein
VSQPATQDATTIGQIVLFLTFLLNTAVQLWRERSSKKEAEAQRREAIRVAEATKAELIIRDEDNKRKLAEQTAQLKGALRDRVEEMSKRFEDLLPPK